MKKVENNKTTRYSGVGDTSYINSVTHTICAKTNSFWEEYIKEIKNDNKEDKIKNEKK